MWEGLAKTRQGFQKGLSRILTGSKPLDAELLESLEELFIQADLGGKATQRLLSKLQEDQAQGRLKPSGPQGSIEMADIKQALKQEFSRMFQEATQQKALLEDSKQEDGKQPSPRVILVVGVNGVGKTTTIGKLAAQYRRKGERVFLAAGDTFRAAAIEQLQIWGQRIQCDVIAQQPGSDPSAVVFDAMQAAIARQADKLIVDTAGRLHTKSNLMEELKKIKRVMGKILPESPHQILLVLDATTGQNALQQARTFHQAVGVTDIAITKLDGTAKGGILAAVVDELKIPITYVGVGEKEEDLLEFDPDSFVEGLFE